MSSFSRSAITTMGRPPALEFALHSWSMMGSSLSDHPRMRVCCTCRWWQATRLVTRYRRLKSGQRATACLTSPQQGRAALARQATACHGQLAACGTLGCENAADRHVQTGGGGCHAPAGQQWSGVVSWQLLGPSLQEQGHRQQPAWSGSKAAISWQAAAAGLTGSSLHNRPKTRGCCIAAQPRTSGQLGTATWRTASQRCVRLCHPHNLSPSITQDLRCCKHLHTVLKATATQADEALLSPRLSFVQRR